jgi:polysaccharide biosynthesis/export protein
MQPAKLGALTLYSLLNALLGMALLAPATPAQDVMETPQQANDRIKTLSASARAIQHDYIIGNGDLLDIEVFDVKELSREVRVSQTGSIGLPLVPVRLHVSGLTDVQAEQKITEVLIANGLVSHPEVSVTVKDRKSKPITVIGAVAHPMVFQADHPVTLLEVLAEAGGVANDAGDTILVSRPVVEQFTDVTSDPTAVGSDDAGQAPAPPGPSMSASSRSSAAPGGTAAASATTANEPPPLNNTFTVNLNELMETGDPSHNLVLQAGDVVTVPHSGIVYVLGAVGKPGGFVLANDRSQMTTLKILALAGGLSSTAKSDRAVIIRKDSQGQQHEVSVDLNKVQKRQVEDVQLRPSDILYVPNSTTKKALLRSAEFGLALGSGVALYRLAYH